MLRSGLLALAMMALVVPASAGPFEDGAAAYKREDYAVALELWQPLAEQGHDKAQHNLGLMYDNGLGVPQDETEAVKWFRKAAEQDYGLAQFQLGIRYLIGRGVPQDHVLAHMWFNIAAAPGDEMAESARDKVAMLMTTDQIAEAKRMAREWMAKHQQ